MDMFEGFMSRLETLQQRTRFTEVLCWVSAQFPDLQPKIAWNQPMFTDHGTFIIGFSAAKNHLSVAPEKACLRHFAERIDSFGYVRTQELFRIPWDSPVNYALLADIIAYNRIDKAACATFWRK